MKSKITLAEIFGKYSEVPYEFVQLPPEEAGVVIGGDSDPVDTGTLANWRSTNKYDLNFVKVGSNIRYSLSDCLAFVERRLMNHTGGSIHEL